MANEIDLANDMNEDFQRFALEQNQRRREPGNYTGIYCIECSEEIPLERRLANPGSRRCIACQELHENWSAL